MQNTYKTFDLPVDDENEDDDEVSDFQEKQQMNKKGDQQPIAHSQHKANMENNINDKTREMIK